MAPVTGQIAVLDLDHRSIISEQNYLVISGSASPSSGTPAPLARLARVGGGSVVKVSNAIPRKEKTKLGTMFNGSGG